MQTTTAFTTQAVPDTDGWGNTYEYYLANGYDVTPEIMGTQSNVVAICSPAKPENGVTPAANTCEGDYLVGGFIATDYEQDIVWANGGFVRAPGRVDQN